MREVLAGSGLTEIVAGNGAAGNSGDGGAATSAELTAPAALAVDGEGNLYILDGSVSVRKVAAGSGTITTVLGPNTLGTGLQQGGIGFDGSGDLYVLDNGQVFEQKPNAAAPVVVAGNDSNAVCAAATDAVGDGCPATQAQLNAYLGFAVDAAGDVFLSSNGCGTQIPLRHGVRHPREYVRSGLRRQRRPRDREGHRDHPDRGRHRLGGSISRPSEMAALRSFSEWKRPSPSPCGLRERASAAEPRWVPAIKN
ncbi:MAG: hypothetical protein ACRD1Y_09940 [Terriglobales bacterium]